VVFLKGIGVLDFLLAIEVLNILMFDIFLYLYIPNTTNTSSLAKKCSVSKLIGLLIYGHRKLPEQ